MGKRPDLINRRFGLLKVESLHPERSKDNKARWICICECGNTRIATSSQLTLGTATGCGCTLSRKARSKSGEESKHWKGGYRTRGSSAWASSKLSSLRYWSEKKGYQGPSNNTTPDIILDLLKKSNGLCNICGVHESVMAKNHSIDHCHETGEIRGILCTNCNYLLGAVEDSIETLQKAIEYLNKNK
jgi:hypothetical protein